MRWVQNSTSTRPKTVSKSRTDGDDIRFIINWLAQNNIPISFDKYEGKSKAELLTMVHRYHNAFQMDVMLLGKLKQIMQPEDWEEMMTLVI
jgi:hypothetical protein